MGSDDDAARRYVQGFLEANREWLEIARLEREHGRLAADVARLRDAGNLKEARAAMRETERAFSKLQKAKGRLQKASRSRPNRSK